LPPWLLHPYGRRRNLCAFRLAAAAPHTVEYFHEAADPYSHLAAQVLADLLARYDIALQVIDLRRRRGLTQRQLAERCGIDQADISRIERGSTSPTAISLQRIAEALDADLRLVSRVP
jgi:ribosome-binding protein aMBF1 (putative translation factor)